MGLTGSSVGRGAVDRGLIIEKVKETDGIIALAGNPNVGKSTVFNHLTHLRQHTGNWPGKTVQNACGYCKTKTKTYCLVDIPGTYSLSAMSREEQVARDYICFGGADAVILVCDATCLERNLNLVLQTVELGIRVLVCVNLMDEARRKGVSLRLDVLSAQLGVPVVGTEAHRGSTLTALLDELDLLIETPSRQTMDQPVLYAPPIEQAIRLLMEAVEPLLKGRLHPRWVCLKLLEGDHALLKGMWEYLRTDISREAAVDNSLKEARLLLRAQGIDLQTCRDMVGVKTLLTETERISSLVVRETKGPSGQRDRRVDRILTSRSGGYPFMALLLALVLWLTITGANYPSQLLSKWLFALQELLYTLMRQWGAPDWFSGALILGVYRVLAWVVSVMLPPMAIFFPLFTLLEDAGYLPRVAYNLDKPFQKCSACGKQALTMWVVDDGMREGKGRLNGGAAGDHVCVMLSADSGTDVARWDDAARRWSLQPTEPDNDSGNGEAWNGCLQANFTQNGVYALLMKQPPLRSRTVPNFKTPPKLKQLSLSSRISRLNNWCLRLSTHRYP